MMNLSLQTIVPPLREGGEIACQLLSPSIHDAGRFFMFISPNCASERHAANGAVHYHDAMTSEFSGQINAMVEDVCSWLEQDQEELAKLMRRIEDWRARASVRDEQEALRG
jgi:hypothetical protein